MLSSPGADPRWALGPLGLVSSGVGWGETQIPPDVPDTCQNVPALTLRSIFPGRRPCYLNGHSNLQKPSDIRQFRFLNQGMLWSQQTAGRSQRQAGLLGSWRKNHPQLETSPGLGLNQPH